MSGLEEARKRYQTQFGTPQIPSYSQWEPPVEKRSLKDILQSFLNTAPIPPQWSWRFELYFHHLEKLDFRLVVDHILPSLRLVDIDLICELVSFVPHIDASFLTGFFQSFATLIRAHKVRYVQCAWGVTNGELLVSWMADIFFSPISLINIEAVRAERAAVYANTVTSVTNGSITAGSVTNGSVTNIPKVRKPVARRGAAKAKRLRVNETGSRADAFAKEHVVIDLTETGHAETDLTEVDTDQTAGDLVHESRSAETADTADTTDTVPVDPSTIESPSVNETATTSSAPTSITPTSITPSSITPTSITPTAIAPTSNALASNALPEETPPYTPIPDIMAKVEELIKTNPPEPAATARARITETSVLDVISNLNVRYPRLATSWPEDMLPGEQSFPSPEAAIHYAMNHAFPRHYQLLQRYENNTIFLYCNRMSHDEMDTKWNKDYLAIRVRDSCKFALRVDRDQDNDTWHLKHVENCSEHNHMPNIDPKVFPENEIFIERSSNAKTPDFSDTYLEQLLNAPFIFSRTNGSNLFFAHTQGYRFWRAYPEVMLIEDVLCRTINEKHYRVVMIRGVDCHDEAVPIAAAVVHVIEDDDKNETAVYRWILEQLTALLEAFNLPNPGFVQVRCDAFEACQKTFPDSYIFLDPDAIEDFACKILNQKKIFNKAARDSLVFQWQELLALDTPPHLLALMTPQDMSRVFDKMWHAANKKGRQFLDTVEGKLQNAAKIYKLREAHFDVGDCKQYECAWKIREEPASVFQMVHGLLQQSVSIYENRSLHNAIQHVSTNSASGNPSKFQKAQMVISRKARGEVRKTWQELKKWKVPPARCTCRKTVTRGYGCQRCLYTIIRTRKHSPSDFHPHWRNLYADLGHVDVDETRKYASQWAELEVGVDVFDRTGRARTGRAAKQ